MLIVDSIKVKWHFAMDFVRVENVHYQCLSVKNSQVSKNHP